MTLNSNLAQFATVNASWPRMGRHILATYDEEHIVVYQAYRPELGNYAAEHQKFGGAYSFSRMSWIKPNFLWMMYRSGWGTKDGQEVILAVTITRALFEVILEQAVPSSYWGHLYSRNEDWKKALQASEVRLQWDPDHNPYGGKVERKAIQLGLRGEMLRRYAETEVVEIEDISCFVAQQRAHVEARKLDQLVVPNEKVYVPKSLRAKQAVGLVS